MKRLLFQLSSIICCVILLSSCEQEDVIINNIQYIQGPANCIATNYVSWSENGVNLLTQGSYIQFKTKMNGTLSFTCINDKYAELNVYIGNKLIGEYQNTGDVQIKSIKKNSIIKFSAGTRANGEYGSFVGNIILLGEGSSTSNTDNPNPGFDF